MNYTTHYTYLIERARKRDLVGYCERHHIMPRCMGGSDEPQNIVRLTAEEHYVAHQLLVKMYPKTLALIRAAAILGKQCSGNKAYGWLRSRISEMTRGVSKSAEHRQKIAEALRGNKNGIGNQNRRGKTASQETLAKLSAAKRGKRKSPEHRAKISAAHIGKKRQPFSLEWLTNMSVARLGKKASPETRAKLSAAQYARWAYIKQNAGNDANA